MGQRAPEVGRIEVRRPSQPAGDEFLIERLFQSRTRFAMGLHRQTNDRVAQLIVDGRHGCSGACAQV
jgi:hypothetical protein